MYPWILVTLVSAQRYNFKIIFYEPMPCYFSDLISYNFSPHPNSASATLASLQFGEWYSNGLTLSKAFAFVVPLAYRPLASPREPSGLLPGLLQLPFSVRPSLSSPRRAQQCLLHSSLHPLYPTVFFFITVRYTTFCLVVFCFPSLHCPLLYSSQDNDWHCWVFAE